jgi:hypothetical protein
LVFQCLDISREHARAHAAAAQVPDSSSSDEVSIDSEIRRSRAAAALVKDYGDLQDGATASSLPTVEAAFDQVVHAFSACLLSTGPRVHLVVLWGSQTQSIGIDAVC